VLITAAHASANPARPDLERGPPYRYGGRGERSCREAAHERPVARPRDRERDRDDEAHDRVDGRERLLADELHPPVVDPQRRLEDRDQQRRRDHDRRQDELREVVDQHE
jgi:hypothetical protein